ncbi:MAG: M28 family peptidase [Paludibacteraceae bacterium]|nr:M28 family peptidase [Paludibacteraceae bacterium]
MFKIVRYSIYVLLLLCVSCAKQQQSSRPTRLPFDADSAYAYIHQQMAFGARVPGSPEHEACGDWLMHQLSRHGAQVKEQIGTILNYSGQLQAVRNIVGYWQGTLGHTIMLCAHWDTRPWTDEEPDYADRFDPVPGANDGASGVGVILEIVRQMQVFKAQGKPIPSLQIVFFDCEDMGTPTHYTGKQREHTWCLGSQLWARDYRQAIANQLPTQPAILYGILLDMVGDPSATFPREYFSTMYASGYVEKIWRTAAQLGYARYFVQQATLYPITDDHYYVNTLAGIPCVDIIDYKGGTETGFPEWWHTRADDMQNINKQTLQAVGETVLTTICSK